MITDDEVPIIGGFPRGTCFFSDDGEPVATIPTPIGELIVNFWGGRAGVIPASEFGRNNRPRSLSEEEFRDKAGPRALRDWFERSSPRHGVAPRP